MSWNPVNDLKKAFNKLKDQLNSTANSAKNSINWVKDQAKKELYKVKDDCKKAVQGAANTAKDGVEKEIKELGDKAKHEFDSIKNETEDKLKEAKSFAEDLPNQLENVADELKDELEKVLKSAVGSAMKGALEYALKKLKETKVIKRFSLSVDFNVFSKMLGGSFSVGWGNIGEDKEKLITVIGEWINKPPTKRSEIVEFIKLVAPDSIDVQVSAVTIGADFDDWIDELDGYLDDIGIPE